MYGMFPLTVFIQSFDSRCLSTPEFVRGIFQNAFSRMHSTFPRLLNAERPLGREEKQPQRARCSLSDLSPGTACRGQPV